MLPAVVGAIAAILAIQVALQLWTRRKMQSLSLSYSDISEAPKNAVVVVSNPATCFWCYKMETASWAHSDVLVFLAKHEISVIRTKSDAALCAALGLKQRQGIPRVHYFTADGSHRACEMGFRPPAKLVGDLARHLVN